MRVLFLLSRFPYPPWRGDQVRAFHQLRQLARRHEITLCTVGRPPALPERAKVEEIGVAVHVIPISIPGALARMGRFPFDRRPAQALPLTGRRARSKVAELAAEADLVHAQLIRTGPLLPEDGPPVVIDMVDALSENLRRRARHDRSVRGLLARWEAGRIVSYETELARRGAAVIAATEADAAALGDDAAVVPNGVDMEAFAFRDTGRDPGKIVFAGNLGYFPNVDAARIAATEVLPVVRGGLPTATLTLAGARPAMAVRKLGRLPGVVLVAEPEDLGATVARAAVAVVPMRAGTGMQNKVLEAMAVGTPVVTTPRTAEAIGAKDGEHLLVGADGPAIGRAALVLLGDPDRGRRIAVAARRLVEERFSWAAAAEGLERVWEDVAR